MHFCKFINKKENNIQYMQKRVHSFVKREFEYLRKIQFTIL